MRLRITLAAMVAAVVAAVGTPAAAVAGPNDNESATVTGVASVAAAACPSGYFCLYTRPNYTGRMFKLYYCRDYAMSRWNGVGSVRNRNTDEAMAWLLDQYKQARFRYDAGDSNPRQDFRPIWYAKACL
jgi:hypothetical protein